MIPKNKEKQNINELQFINNFNIVDENNNKKENSNPFPKKQNFKRYKFHIFHHNNLLNQIKSMGIDMNLMDNILNTNNGLIFELLKNNEINPIRNHNMKKSFSEIIKPKSKTNDINVINAIQKFYENYMKKNKNKNSKFIKINPKKEKQQMSSDNIFKIKNNNNNINFNSENINSNVIKKRRFSSNNTNTLSIPFIKLDDYTKEKFCLTKKKGRASAQLNSNKNYLSFIETNNIQNEKQSKKTNSTLDILSGNSNNILFFNNKKSIFKNTFTNLGKYNKIFYIRNKKKPINKYYSQINQPHIKGGINFKKMLSRDYLNNLKTEKVDGIYSTATPSYQLVEPKCIMKVSYSNKKHFYKNSDFKGLGPEATFDMDKLFFKYNNHSPPKSFNFEKMVGRGHILKSKLPIFMINQVDRNACNIFNEKNLKMNYYSNGQLKQLISCFNEKKSFNFKLKESNEEKNEEKKNFENYAKQIFEKGINNNNDVKSSDEESLVLENRIVNSIPFRVNSLYKNFMAEYNRKSSAAEKIDGITFKNFKIANKIRAKKLI